MLYKLRPDLAPGRDDEIIALPRVWDTGLGPTPPELVALDVAFHFVKALAGAISRHPEGAVFGPLFPPSCLQLACYSGSGARYVKHLDNPPYLWGPTATDDQRAQSEEGEVGSRSMDRRLTALLYLNLRWVPEHGGCVRLYEQDGGGQTAPLQDDGVVAAQIEPIGGRLVLFDARTVPHEVMPAFAERWALSAWIADKSPTAQLT